MIIGNMHVFFKFMLSPACPEGIKKIDLGL